MTTQLTIPPARVWERIEKILDKQDADKKHTDKLIFDTLNKQAHSRRNNHVILTFMAMSLLALIAHQFKYSPAFKNN